MNDSQPTIPVRLFYSYSHLDEIHRARMETAVMSLQHEGLLQQWSDHNITPGSSISDNICKNLTGAHIVAFLMSPDFIASSECRKEWEFARNLHDDGNPIIRIPIILRECAWKDFISPEDLKALPNDGRAISVFLDPDKAWLQVYEGVKSALAQWRHTFTVRPEIIRRLNTTEFISADRVKLTDLFVFLTLTLDLELEPGKDLRHSQIDNKEQLLRHSHVAIYGPENSGKSALANHLFVSLVEQSKPVLFIDSDAVVPGRRQDTIFRDAYHSQFYGDFDFWAKQTGKTLIFDGLTSSPRMLSILSSARDIFDNIIVTISSDVFISFFTDETRLADFQTMKIEPLNRAQQEELIRKRLESSDLNVPITDGYIDQIEDRVNSIIVARDIVPRYPFYVLSILQTYEGFMPSDISITSYGHCYYVLIVASLSRSGISDTAGGFNACFNFSEHLAFSLYTHDHLMDDTPFDFSAFVEDYKNQFYMPESLVSRLQHASYGLITKNGTFRADFMYYYFLAKYLSNHDSDGRPVINSMSEESYRKENYLTLLFTIHHTRDGSIIDDILLRTMCTMDTVEPAELHRVETRQYLDILARLPEDILSSESVQEARKIQRISQDSIESEEVDSDDEGHIPPEIEMVNDVYRILINNKVMGQVLRNNFGNLEKHRLEEIIEVIADSGLRLISFFVGDEKEINHYAGYIHEANPDWEMSQIINTLQYLSFVWTMINIDQVVEAINVPEIRESINSVVVRQSTPAYDLIGYFSQLRSAKELSYSESESLASLLNTHKNNLLVSRVLSLKTQSYMNTHGSPSSIEQSICSHLGIKYRPRLQRGN